MYFVFVDVKRMDEHLPPIRIYDSEKGDYIFASEVEFPSGAIMKYSKLHTYFGEYSARVWVETDELEYIDAESVRRTL